MCARASSAETGCKCVVKFFKVFHPFNRPFFFFFGRGKDAGDSVHLCGTMCMDSLVVGWNFVSVRVHVV